MKSRFVKILVRGIGALIILYFVGFLSLRPFCMYFGDQATDYSGALNNFEVYVFYRPIHGVFHGTFIQKMYDNNVMYWCGKIKTCKIIRK